jgi:chromosome transmission fidelity protein 18
LGSFDLLSGAVHSDREYAVMPYLSYCLVPFYIYFGERGGRRIENSKADWEVRSHLLHPSDEDH